jgi:hypothetical protein
VYVYQAWEWGAPLRLGDSPTILSTALRDLCGGAAAANIVVATPKWDLLQQSWENSKQYERSELEKKLAERDEELKAKFLGMDVQQHHHNSPESAWKILEPVLKRWGNSTPSPSVTTTPAIKTTTATSSRGNGGTHGGGKCCVSPFCSKYDKS